jgi:chromosome condensin MukBEF ATPase and DNA-binding subunit MukB
MNSLTITISDIRAIDGWVEASNRAGMTPEAMGCGMRICSE